MAKAFGKRKAVQHADGSELTVNIYTSLSTVLVRRSVVDAARLGGKPHDLIAGVVGFVNAMTARGLYLREQIVLKALQAFHADFYLAQVNNGGHSQFIHNCGGKAPPIYADAMVALRSCGADAQADILERMMVWEKENPVEAGSQTGFSGGRADTLDKLDTEFFEVNSVAPMADALARWILQWPELIAVDDANFNETLDRLVFSNPRRRDLLSLVKIKTLEHQTGDWHRVAIVMAASAVIPVETCVEIGPGTELAIEGRKQKAWRIMTSNGLRYAVVTKTWSRLYEDLSFAGPLPSKAGTAGTLKTFFQQLRSSDSSTGRRLSHVDSSTIDEVIQLAKRHNVAVAIDLLFQDIGRQEDAITVSGAVITRDAAGAPCGGWVVTVKGEPYFVKTTEKGATLVSTDVLNGDVLAFVSLETSIRRARTLASLTP